MQLTDVLFSRISVGLGCSQVLDCLFSDQSTSDTKVRLTLLSRNCKNALFWFYGIYLSTGRSPIFRNGNFLIYHRIVTNSVLVVGCTSIDPTCDSCFLIGSKRSVFRHQASRNCRTYLCPGVEHLLIGSQWAGTICTPCVVATWGSTNGLYDRWNIRRKCFCSCACSRSGGCILIWIRAFRTTNKYNYN